MTSEPYRRPRGTVAGRHTHQPGGLLVFANPAAGRLCGRRTGPSELVGRSLTDIFHADGHAARQERLEQVSSGLAVAPFEEQIVGLDGGVTDVEVALTRLDDTDASPPAAIVLTMREISERKRADATLRESEERLTLAFAGAQEGVWDWNLVTGDVVYSPRWKQMLGYADDEIEPHVSAWERLLHPDDMPRAQEVNESVARGGALLRGRVPAPPQGRPLRPGALARLSGPARARRPGRPHRRHALRPHGTPAGGGRASADGAPLAARVRPGGRAPAHRARDARSIRRAADGAQPQHRRAQGRFRRIRRDSPASSIRSKKSPGRSIATSTSSSGSFGRPRSTTSACARRSPTTSRTGRGASTFPAELHTSGLLDDRLASEAETTLYRVAQEALTNVAKHSRAQRVDVILERQADSVLLIVEDDGVGFDADQQRKARPATDSGCSGCRSGPPSSARRSRSNRPRARARRYFSGWRSRRTRHT